MNTIKRIEHISECPCAEARYIALRNAYLLDGRSVYFEILGKDSAMILNYTGERLAELIAEFRFYNYNITRYYDAQHRLLRSYEPVPLTEAAIADLQPSQFYVNKDKLQNCASWIESKEQLIIPVFPDSNIICDGHTRLYAAWQKGISQCYTYPADDVDQYIHDFVREAQTRGIYRIDDLTPLYDEDYKKLWYAFCDKYFASQQQN